MNVLGHILHCKALPGGTTWANEMNFIMNHTTGAGLIANLLTTS